MKVTCCVLKSSPRYRSDIVFCVSNVRECLEFPQYKADRFVSLRKATVALSPEYVRRSFMAQLWSFFVSASSVCTTVRGRKKQDYVCDFPMFLCISIVM